MKSIVILILSIQPVFGQSVIQKYIKNNTVAIKSVDPDESDYTDLDPILKAIGDKRIVMLGELFHGDGTALAAKSRIIKCLHEKLGFNVLAFESDFFALNRGWEVFKKGKISLDSLLQASIFPIWTRCKQCESLFKYIEDGSSKPNSLIVTGLDNQQVSGYSKVHLKDHIKSFLDTANIEFIKSPMYLRFLSLIDSSSVYTGNKDRIANTLDTLVSSSELILSELSNKYSFESFDVKIIENLAAFCNQMKSYINSKGPNINSAKIRDSQMADNLNWLCTSKYPKEKIIVWAHNGHIWKNSDPAYNKNYNEAYSMGYLFTRNKACLNDSYIMGFTECSGSGKFTTQSKITKVVKPKKNSLEYWLKQSGHEFAFVDFNDFSMQNPKNEEMFYMKTYIDRQALSYWQKVFDGIFYIENMKPCIETDGLL